MLNKEKHPFYEHSDGIFWVAKKDNKIVGRLGAFVNNPFNEYHKVKKAQFYLFDCIDDQEVASYYLGRHLSGVKNEVLMRLLDQKDYQRLTGTEYLLKDLNIVR